VGRAVLMEMASGPAGPSKTLQANPPCFDEADLYLPSVASRRSNEPMENLPIGPRSAGSACSWRPRAPATSYTVVVDNIRSWFLCGSPSRPQRGPRLPLLSDCRRRRVQAPRQLTGLVPTSSGRESRASAPDRSLVAPSTPGGRDPGPGPARTNPERARPGMCERAWGRPA